MQSISSGSSKFPDGADTFEMPSTNPSGSCVVVIVCIVVSGDCVTIGNNMDEGDVVSVSSHSSSIVVLMGAGVG